MKLIWQQLLEKLLPIWMQDKSPDPKHFYRRLFTQKYLQKKQRLKYYWLSLAIFLSQINSLALIIGILLMATFITFAILDEG
ncbi:hypothetical protein [Spartinivicinus ruber]|uniref:hypothetical protein n=1 Tax=Spartinivicinus ruber TaxID=2683272 RepID=UPI0013D66E98|nr:hypothetical protein [Spartinivicinus ruber]